MIDCLQNFYCVVNVSDNLFSLISLLKDSSGDELESEDLPRQLTNRDLLGELHHMMLLLLDSELSHMPIMLPIFPILLPE